MAKYRLLNRSGLSDSFWVVDKIYDSDLQRNQYWNSVQDMANKYPNNWELIKEKTMSTEKTIKLSLEQAKKMYGKSPEMDELLLANFSKEELTKKELPKNWKELNNVQGWKISAEGAAVRADVKDVSPVCRRGRFVTEKQAKSALAAAQLSQLMAVYNDGWKPIWNYTNNRSNWCIVRSGDELKWQNVGQTYSFLAFKSLEICELFMKNFEPLIKEYFMID